MRTLPTLAMLGLLACAGQAAADAVDGGNIAHPTVSAMVPTIRGMLARRLAPDALASLVTSVGESGGLTELSAPPAAPPPSVPATPEPSADLGAPGTHWGRLALRPRPARDGDDIAPALLMDASTDQAPDSGPVRPRVPGAYAPYQAEPPLLEQKLDPPALLASLASRGFTDVSQLRLRGSADACEATGPRRERVRLVVDAASGAVFGVEIIGCASRRN
ncbi:MAG: hypothetical protein B7Y70_03150 [Rhizobiales bacterium 35-68-8]|nr:MAG: hypothetical protein B7Y70_03150 [Rhizobiales bacterium 35-68-8]